MADLSKFQELLNTEDQTSQYDVADIQANTVWGGLAYVLFFLPLIGCPKSSYGKFHANQALLLVIAGIALSIVVGIAGFIPFFIGDILEFVLGLVRTIALLGLGIIGLINGFTGKVKQLPLIGGLVTIIK